MKRAIIVTTAFVCLVPIAGAQAGGWVCSAPGLADGSYDGGSTAYIHLRGFTSGDNYPVTKRGKVATGVTLNGTHFTCREK
jgi:hypothetical protein